MDSVGCTIKLLGDADNSFTIRQCDLSMSGRLRSGTWDLSSDSDDPRLQIGATTGKWALWEAESRDGTYTAYLFDPSDENTVLLEFYGLPSLIFENVSCGTDLTGQGLHLGPPQTVIVYRIWVGCA